MSQPSQPRWPLWLLGAVLLLLLGLSYLYWTSPTPLSNSLPVS